MKKNGFFFDPKNGVSRGFFKKPRKMADFGPPKMAIFGPLFFMHFFPFMNCRYLCRLNLRHSKIPSKMGSKTVKKGHFQK